MSRFQNSRHAAVSTAAVVGVVIIVAIVAGIGSYYVFTSGSSPGSSSTASSTTTSSTTSSTTSASGVMIMVPADAGSLPTTGCWSSSSCSNSNATQGAEVSNLYFSPDNVTLVIGVNNTVEWQNPNPVPHTVTSTSVPSGASTFSLQLGANSHVSYTFAVPGVYYYRCTVHPWMGGEIIVKSGTSSSLGGY